MIATTDLRRTATAVLGAALLSATCVLGAVGPARAEAPQAAAKAAAPAKVIALAYRPILM